jgi:hypothetical protein
MKLESRSHGRGRVGARDDAAREGALALETSPNCCAMDASRQPGTWSAEAGFTPPASGDARGGGRQHDPHSGGGQANGVCCTCRLETFEGEADSH